MKIFTLLPRWFAVFGLLIMFCSSNASAVILDTDTFDNTDDVEGWDGSGESWDASGQLEITRDKTATKTFTFSSYANQSVIVTLDATKIGEWESDDHVQITANGTSVYNSNTTGTISFSAILNESGELALSIMPDGGSGEDLFIDNVSIVTIGYRPFTLRKQLYTQGNMKTIGNTILVNPTGTVDCDTYTDGEFGDGDGSTSNAGYTLCGYSVDGTQTNATTAELPLPAGAKVVWAGLYWQSIQANGDFSSNMTIKFRQDGSSYVNIIPDTLDYQANSGHTGYTSYSAFTDVTSYFGEGKWNEGNYTAADIPTFEGQIDSLGSYGAWSLVAVYQVNGELFRSFSIFDGWQAVKTPSAGTLVSVPVTVDGFYTPNRTGLNASVSVFAAEGDAYFGTTDSRKDVLSTYDYNNANAVVDLGTIYNTFQSSITGGGFREPEMTNNMGIDIQTFDIGAYLKPQQESMTFNFQTAQDTYWPSMLAFSTEIYTPKFCYDYGYEQNGISFTETNNGVSLPRLVGTLPNTEDINVSLYVRNTEVSDIAANNMYFNIDNIDTNQATYVRNTTAVTFPKQYIPTYKTDSGWPLSVSDGHIHNIPIGDINSAEYFYTYYTLRPISSGDINMSIEGTFGYDLTITKADGSLLIIPYGSSIGGEALPMCSANNFSYTPTWGIFSMVDAGLYDDTTGNRYYDLATQVVRRPANLRIASFQPAPNLDTPQKVSTLVAVEMIDASQFHDIDAACAEPSSATTPRVWVGFENNVSQINFNAAAIQYAIDNDQVSDIISGLPSTLTSPADFYNKATQNAAFRVTYNTLNDADGSLIDIQGLTDGKLRINNFSDIHKVYPHCRKPVKNPNNVGMTDLTSVACSDNGNNSTWGDIAICMECLYGADTKVLCSRDNFAIRPESYNVKLKDVNNTTNVVMNSFATDRTGVITPNTDRVNMAGGYIYNYEINATNHVDNTNTQGYTRFFNGANNDYNITLVWEPATAPSTAGCNDTNSSAQSFFMANGAINANGSLDQVGEYRLNMIDKTWTDVDQNTSHQTGGHFLTGAECIVGSNAVPLQSAAVALSGGALINLAGCDIGSNHDNVENNLKSRDYLMTFNPHHFNMNLTYGLGKDGNSTAGGFVYDADLNNINDMNMSVRSTGTISAVGYQDQNLTNFVKECYAKDLNVTLGHNATLTLATPFVSRSIYEDNVTKVQIFDSGELVVGAGPFVTVDDSNFIKDKNGSVGTVFRFNYDRNITTPLDPQIVAYTDMNVTCSVNGQCSRQADGVVGDAKGTDAMDFNVTHGYGRYHPTNIKVYGNSPFSELSYMEVFNAPMINGIALTPSRFNTGWFINNEHNGTNLGEAFIDIREGSDSSVVDVNSTIDVGNATYPLAGQTPPYRARAHVNTEGWLWHGMGTGVYTDPIAGDSLPQCNNHPCFYIDVLPVIGRAGSAETDGGSKDNKSSSNEAIGGWSSTSEYAPAIR